MSDATEDFDAVKGRVLAEFANKGFGRKALSFKEATELREYAKARADLHSENLTMEQSIWKSLYEGLTEELRKASPDSTVEIQQLEATSGQLESSPRDDGVEDEGPSE